VLAKEKIVKLEVCTTRGNILLTITKNYSFPQKLIEERGIEEVQTVMVKGKNLPVFTTGAFVNVVSYTKSGDRVNYPSRIDLSTELQLNITLQTEHSKKLEDRRRYYKVSAEIACRVTSVTRGENHLELDPPLESVIQDINVGGVFIKANDRVELKTEDVAAIVIGGVMGEEAEIVIKVLRVQMTPEGQAVGYGCCFLYLNSHQEEIIAKYINKIQIEQRALEREEKRANNFNNFAL